ncbi:MAG TPA: hypothetical protein VGZ90_13640 [Puia sp.]|jgi:hypothetical protein|nr:hypothetical protein [Puia sp.]
MNKDQEKILECLSKELNCGCQTHGFLYASNCEDCKIADSVRYNWFYDFGKAVRTYLLNELVTHPEFHEFGINFDGLKLTIHPMNTDGKTLDIQLFQDPR